MVHIDDAVHFPNLALEVAHQPHSSIDALLVHVLLVGFPGHMPQLLNDEGQSSTVALELQPRATERLGKVLAVYLGGKVVGELLPSFSSA